MPISFIRSLPLTERLRYPAIYKRGSCSYCGPQLTANVRAGAGLRHKRKLVSGRFPDVQIGQAALDPSETIGTSAYGQAEFVVSIFVQMRQRPSSRLLVINSDHRVLLFRFEHKAGPLAGQTFWATPGGGLDPGESYEDAARRELVEETGLRCDDIGPQVAQRMAQFKTPDAEVVIADERFFLVRVDGLDVSDDRWTALEREVMADHRWWSLSDLHHTAEQVWPEDLADLLVAIGIWRTES